MPRRIENQEFYFGPGETVLECRGPQLKRSISKDETAEIFPKMSSTPMSSHESIERPW